MERVISERAASAVLEREGAAGLRWLESLTGRAERVCKERGVALGAALGGGALSAVCSASGPDGPCVVKFCVRAELAVAEAATLSAWAATADRAGLRCAFPRVLWLDPGLGGYAMELVVGAQWSKTLRSGPSPADRERVGMGVAAALAQVAATAPLEGVPQLPRLHGERAVLDQLSSDPALGRFVPAARRGAATLEALCGDRSRFVAAHGDLWCGNVLDGGAACTVIDPFPNSGPVACAAARWCADGWWAAGYEHRRDRIAEVCRLDRRTLDELAGFYVAAQAATFARHRWDPAPLEAGWDDVLAAVASGR